LSEVMIRFLLYALAAWFLYKLVFDFIIPVFRTTRIMKKKFREMHDRMQEQQTKQEGFAEQAPRQKATSKSRGEDYIDFEEVK